MGTELYASLVRAVETVFWMYIPDPGTEVPLKIHRMLSKQVKPPLPAQGGFIA